MVDVLELLDSVRKKPGLYLNGEKSLKLLYVFLAGYERGLFAMGSKEGVFGTLRPFNTWVAKELGFGNSTSGWYNMISSKAENDQHGFDLFFELFDAFRREN